MTVEDMIPAYCINLDRRTDRWLHMSGMFERIGLTVERLPATDGQDPQAALVLAQHPAAALLSTGALACFESHRRAWQRLIDSGASHALVFEDDLLIAPGLARFQQAGWIPPEVNLVKIETNGNRLHLARYPLYKISDDRTLVRLNSYHAGAGGYILSCGLARKLLPLSRDCLEPVDDFLFDRFGRYGFIAHQMVPAPVMQGKSQLARAQAGNWAEASITEHWTDTVEDSSDQKEGLVGRVLRRVREELRARRLGSRYVAVPWG